MKKFFLKKELVDLSKTRTFVILIILIGIMAVLIRNTFFSMPGIEWRMVLAERLLAGGKIGKEIYEINTPFSNMLYIPSVIFYHLFKISGTLTTYTFTTFCVFLCIHLSSNILKSFNYKNFDSIKAQNIFKTSFFSAFLFLSLHSYSEREHWIAALLLPYTLIKLAPITSTTSLNKERQCFNLIGNFLLLIALLIKPHYIISALIIITFSFLLKKKIFLITKDLQEILLVSIILFFTNILFFPDWLPIAFDAWFLYSGMNKEKIKLFISLGEALIIPFFSLILIYKKKSMHIEKDFFLSCLILVLANSIVFIIQQKGWHYQTLTFVLPLWGLVFFKIFQFVLKNINYFFIPFLSLIFLFSYLTLNNYENTYNFVLSKERNGWPNEVKKLLKPGEAFVCVSLDENCAFPLGSMNSPYIYASRFLDLWPLEGARSLWKKGALKTSDYKKYRDRHIHYIVEDIKNKNVKIIIVEWPIKKSNSTIEDFSDNNEFLKLLQQYTLVKYNSRFFLVNAGTWIYFKY